MKLPGLLQGIGAAAVLTAGAVMLLAVFSGIWFYQLAPRLVLCCLAALYVGYLLGFSAQRKGWTTYFVACAVLLLISYHASLSWTAAAVGVFVWLSRQLIAQRSALPALADLLLSAMAVGAFFWALSTSFAIAVWSFFLVQAASVFIPAKFCVGRNGQKQPLSVTVPVSSDRFAYAHKVAEAALQQLIG